MREQVSRFTSLGLSAEFVGEGQKNPEAKIKVLNGDAQIVLISPENILCNKLYRNMFLTSAYKEHLVAVVIDEAHCVKTW